MKRRQRDDPATAVPPEPGKALWAGPIGPHYVENVGQTDLHIVAIEVK